MPDATGEAKSASVMTAGRTLLSMLLAIVAGNHIETCCPLGHLAQADIGRTAEETTE